jgi:addiction module HigA family antidote
MATELTTAWRPDWAATPGDLLGEALEERSMSQAELARRMGRPLKTINEIVKGKQAITPKTAVQLQNVLGVAAHFWLNLQRDFDEVDARRQEGDELAAELDWLRRFPIAEMIRRNWIAKMETRVEQLKELLGYFAIASPGAWRSHWAASPATFRQSPSFRSKPEAVAAWLRQGERRAALVETSPFNHAGLRASLNRIRAMTTLDPVAFLPDLESLLAANGVAFVLVPELSGIHIAGATRWLAPDKVMIQLSLRHRSNDHFWFALFHEIGHILAGRREHLDDAKPDTVALQASDEAEADRFAVTQLVPDAAIAKVGDLDALTADAIRAIAEKLGVSPGIVVGRLEHARRLSPARFRYLKKTWDWAGLH